jgi:hypothetical protein
VNSPAFGGGAVDEAFGEAFGEGFEFLKRCNRGGVAAR